METFEWIIALMAGAAILSLIARRLALPYPSLLAVGGAAVALVPFTPDWTLDPGLALTLFVAPVLLDAAYDFSLRDLKRNWITVSSLAIIAVGVTVVAVAFVARWLVPDMPWAIAIALGAIVAPPDAAAATAVMRYVKLPHRVRTIVEGESLINDASALLVYRLAVAAAVGGSFDPVAIAPTAIIVIVGSIAAGIGLAMLFVRILTPIEDVPVAIIFQFVGTFGAWIIADAVHLSSILTIVAFAIWASRSRARLTVPARVRIPVNSVWATVTFVLNALAFVLIGLQLRPIVTRMSGDGLAESMGIAAAVLLTSVLARFVWVMAYTLFFRAVLPAPVNDEGQGRPTIAGGLIISWAGMRGIVTLATAFALPVTLPDGSPFPYRDLILLCAFFVVLGTLVVQGLTLRPLIAVLRIEAPDPVAIEVRGARLESMQAGLATLADNSSDEARLLRKEFEAAIRTITEGRGDGLRDSADSMLRRTALAAARARANQLWHAGTIGDEAYRVLESELDWNELSAGADAAS